MEYAIAAAIGIVSGVLGGMLGIGGAVVMIPSLVLFLKFNQQAAQGTSVAAMIPPIGIMAAYVYYRSGHVNIPVAACIAAGFLAGGYFGARYAVMIDSEVLRRIFGVLLLVIALRMIFWK